MRCEIGSHWRETRKLVTPAFHFDILQKFFEVFVEQANVLTDILKEHANTNKNFDIGHIMKLFALDVICGKFKKKVVCDNEFLNIYLY